MLFPSTFHALVLVGLLSSHLVTSNPTPGNKQARTSPYWKKILGYSKTFLETADELSRSLHPKGTYSPLLKNPPQSTKKTPYSSKEKCADLHKRVSAESEKHLRSADDLKNLQEPHGGRYANIKAATGELLRESAELFKWYCGVLYEEKPLEEHWADFSGPSGILKLDKLVPEGEKLALFTQKVTNRIYQLKYLLDHPTMFSREGLHNLRLAILVAQVAYYLRIRIAEDPNNKKVVLWKHKVSGEGSFMIDIAKFEKSLLGAIAVTVGSEKTPKQPMPTLEACSFMEYAFVSAFTAADGPNSLPAGGELKGTPYQTEPVSIVGRDLTTRLSGFLVHYENYEKAMQAINRESLRLPAYEFSHELFLKMKSELVAFGFLEEDAKAYEDFVNDSKRTRSINTRRRSDDGSSNARRSSSGSSNDGSSNRQSRFHKGKIQI